MKDPYKNPNKSKGENGYKNKRGVDAIADTAGGMTKKAVKAMRKRKKMLEEI